MLKIKVLNCLLIFLLALGFFGMAVANADDFSGNWQGTWTSFYGRSGDTSASITQSGNNLSGTLTVKNTECGNFNNLSLIGTVSGNIASFQAYAYCPLDGSDNYLYYTDGVLSANSVSGSYNVVSDGDPYDLGTFTVYRSTNTITASAGSGGSISPSGSVSVSAGASQTFTMTPNNGYGILDVIVDGLSVGAMTSYTFINVQSNHSILATFSELAPAANFAADPTSGNIPLAVNFTDQSTGNIASRFWSFGDGATSTEQNPSHSYSSPGSYTVSLTVYGPGGSDTETKPDYITVERKSKAMPWTPLLLDD